MSFFDSVKSLIFSDDQKISPEIISYYEQNPDELDLIIDKEHFHAVYLTLFFILGIGITVLARVVQYLYGDYCGEFVNTVVLDVLSELGIAIFGGAVVAYYIEFLNKRQYQQNLKFRKAVKKALEEKKDKMKG